jgi:endonuclease/exonuclease/phosphatase family metal-dependent hydrolase
MRSRSSALVLVVAVVASIGGLAGLASCGGSDSDLPTPALPDVGAQDADATVDTRPDTAAEADAAVDAVPDTAAEADAAVDAVPDTAVADTAVPDTAVPDTAVADTAPPPMPIVCETGAPLTIRVVAGNVSSGNNQSYDPGHGGRILKALRPDVVMIQEFNYGANSTPEITTFVTRYLGADFTFTRGTGQIPNGVLTRFPILSSGEWTDASVSNRAFVWARIDIPGPRDLVAVSVHLLTSSSGNRNAEATQLSGYLKANVTDGAYIAIGGDFNTDSHSEPAFSAFSAVAITGGPWPADQAGNGNTNASRAKPYDYVIASPALDALQVPLGLGGGTFGAGIVFDTRVFTPIAVLNTAGDPDAVLATDSAASNMQHMAVGRDFAVACP